MTIAKSLLLASIGALVFACGGSNSATKPGESPSSGSGGARTSFPAPTWFSAPPKSPSKLYFVGDSNGASDEASARDLAVGKALAELTKYCGASIKSDSHSLEREANGVYEQVVSVTVDVAGDEITVREAVVRQSSAGKGSDGLYDAYALLEWPREQYEGVLAAQRERGVRALDMFLKAESAEKENNTVASRTALKEAKALLGPMKSQVPLSHETYKNTALLWDAMTALADRLDVSEKERKNVYAVVVECIREGKPANCNGSRAGTVRQALSKIGLKVSAESVPATVASEILSSENPNPDKTVRSAGFVVAVRYTAELQATEGPFTFVRYAARGVVFNTSTNRIVNTFEVPPEKEGHPNFDGAMEKGFNTAEKKLVQWIDTEVRKLK